MPNYVITKAELRELMITYAMNKLDIRPPFTVELDPLPAGAEGVVVVRFKEPDNVVRLFPNKRRRKHVKQQP